VKVETQNSFENNSFNN